MARGSKGIGIRGELEVAELIRNCGFKNARRGQQFSGGSESPDVIGGKKLDARILVEAKLVSHFASKKMRDAYIKSLGECDFLQTPVLVHRFPLRKGLNADNRKLAKRWLVTVDARFFFKLLRKVL